MRVVDILRQNSTLDNGRVIDLLLNPSGVGGGGTIYKHIPSDIAIGVLDTQDVVLGQVHDSNIVLGKIVDLELVKGIIQEDIVVGEIFKETLIKGEMPCP